MLDVVSSENREKTLRFVLTFHGQATDKLPTGYRHITNSRPTVGRQVAYISGKTCWPTVGQLSADRFLGSSSSQLPAVAQFLANCFWSRWVLEYMPTLQQCHKWLLNKRNLAVNDLVLVVDKTVQRSRWLLGCVTKVFPGEDSHGRTAEVKTKDSSLTRPVTKLCLLEEAA